MRKKEKETTEVTETPWISTLVNLTPSTPYLLFRLVWSTPYSYKHSSSVSHVSVELGISKGVKECKVLYGVVSTFEHRNNNCVDGTFVTLETNRISHEKESPRQDRDQRPTVVVPVPRNPTRLSSILSQSNNKPTNI